MVLSDDASAALLAAGLRANGYAATWSSSQREAERLLSSRAYRVVLLHLDSDRDRTSPWTSTPGSMAGDRRSRRRRSASVTSWWMSGSSLPGWRARDHRCGPRSSTSCGSLREHRGRLVSRDQLIRLVWDENWRGSTKTLDVTVAGVRRRLREAAGAESRSLPTITAVRGCGYRLDPPTDLHRMPAAASA